MYDQTEFAAAAAAGCFDPNGLSTGGGGSGGASVDNDVNNNVPSSTAASMILIDEAKDNDDDEHQQHRQDDDRRFPLQPVEMNMAFNMEHCFNTTTNVNIMCQNDQLDNLQHHTSWPNPEDMITGSSFSLINPFDQDQDQIVNFDHHPNFNNLHVAAAAGATSDGVPTTDLLNLLHLPRLPNPCINPFSSSSSLGFLGVNINPSSTGDNVIPHDPLFHLNQLPPTTQPPIFRDLMFQPLFSGGHHGYGYPGSSSSLFGLGDSGMDEGQEGSGGACQEYFPVGDGNGGMFEFGRNDHDISTGGVGIKTKDSKCPKNFVTERQRRVNLNDKYRLLRSLVPSPSKADRASIVGDAIEYIGELNRTVNELKHLVERKRLSKERIKSHKGEEDGRGGAAGGGSGTVTGDVVESPGHGGAGAVVKSEQVEQSFNGSSSSALRSSWLQRKCKDTEVDVRIIDDEVTIKLIQRKKISCILLYVSRTLDELQLDLRHVAGGHCGDYYSFLFNTKIYEGSSVYASAIANRLIEVVDRQYAAAVLPTATY
ncbi:hypothetical protein Droror1_Dr00025790 [Drosera rotundifolia]